MKNTMLILAGSVWVLACFAIVIAHDEKNEKCSTVPPWMCMGVPVNEETSGLYKAREECKAQMRKEKKDDVKDRLRGATCLEMCKAKKVEVVDSKGTPQKSKFDALVDVGFPANAANKIKTNATVCFEENKDLMFNKTDIGCFGYRKFISCICHSVAQNCDEDYDEIDWGRDM